MNTPITARDLEFGDSPVIVNSTALQKADLDVLSVKFPVSERPELGRQVNFGGVNSSPMQRWFHYREGYALTLARDFIKENRRKGGVAMDPFCGCGTTMLAARQEESPSVGIEINPIFAMVSAAKTLLCEKADLAEIREMRANLLAAGSDGQQRQTSFPLAGKVFNAEILQALLQFKDIVDGAKRTIAHNALLIAWLSIVESVSNIRKEGNGIKYRFVKRTPDGYRMEPQAKWEARYFPANRFEFVKERLCQKITEIVEDMELLRGRQFASAQVIHGDCLAEMEKWDGDIGVALFSPPYCNCFDYFEIHKVELWLGGFVNSRDDLRRLRRRGFCSNTNADLTQNRKSPIVEVETIATELKNRQLWNKHIPQMVRGYFSDMARLLSAMRLKMKKNACIGIVVGNSAYAGVLVPTDLLIARIAQELGFVVQNIWVCRHLTTSSQQRDMLRPLHQYLRESVVVLRRNG